MDKDGYISNGELFQVLKMMVGNNLKDTQLQQIVDKTIINADKDGDGIVYYTADNQFWSPTAFMDKEEYEIWCEQYNKGTAKKIQWKAIMTWEDYVAIYMQDAVG